MVSFSSKQISNPPSLSERLKDRRQQLCLSLAQATEATNVSIKYLEALESSCHQRLPGEVYARCFLKVYAKFLGLDENEILALYQSEQKIYTKTKKPDDNDFKKPVKRISQFHLMVTPKLIRGIIVGLLALIVLVYLGVKIKAIVTPPVLVINSPADNLVTSRNFIEVGGQAESETILEINGQQVIADDDGNFSETLDLQLGVNVIEIKAEKRHGQQTKIYRQVVVVDDEEETLMNNE